MVKAFLSLERAYLTVGTVESVIPMFLAPDAGDDGNGNICIHSIIMTDEDHDWWMESGQALQRGMTRCTEPDASTSLADRTVLQSRDATLMVARGRRVSRPFVPVVAAKKVCGTVFYKQYTEKYPDGVAQFTRLTVSPLYPVFAGLQLELEQQARDTTVSPLTVQFGRMAVAVTHFPSSTEVSQQGRCDTCHNPFTTL